MTGNAQVPDFSVSCELKGKEFWITDKLYILAWKYADNSAFGIERVYVLQARAKLDLELLNSADTSKTFFIVEKEITR